MLNIKTPLTLTLSACVALLPLAGCDKKFDATQAVAAPQAPQAQATPAYVPPTADQLYQLVGPIALFPDKLVAQVLAASSYPDQVSAADNWLAQNKNLKGSQLQDAANQQPWDVSVKGLTQFPSVLDQMAHNIPWTAALGDAYVNDPTDVMNAIQVMRQRAASSGNLKNNRQLRVAVRPRVQQEPPAYYAPPPDEPLVYAGPEMIPPPPETIVIEPAEPDVVYVPAYDPGVVYGQPLPVYPGYSYEPPPVYYPPSDIVTAGVITFGLGVVVGEVYSHHHDWGWNSWGVHWGGDRDGDRRGDGDRDRDHGWHRPAVVYNNNTYVSNSTTIVNRVTNNTNNGTVINNNNSNNNNTRNNFGGPGSNPAPANVGGPAQPGSPPANFNALRPNVAAQANLAQQPANQNPTPPAGNPRPNHAQPDFNNMTRPNFGKIPPQANGGVAPNLNQLARPGFIRPAPNQPQAGEPGHPAVGQPGQNARPMPNQLQQNAQNRHPAPPRNLEAEKPANLNQHPFFGGNAQRPNINHPAAPEMARPQPVPQPQNVQNRAQEQFQNRANGGQQPHQEMNRPAVNPAPQVFNHQEPRPQPQPQPQMQPRPQPQPQPQPQMQPRPQPQPQPQPQMQPRPQPQPQPQPQVQPRPQPQPQVQQPRPPQENHEQAHDNRGNIHPPKKEEDHK